MWKVLGHFWSVRISLGTDLGICIIIYIINCVLVRNGHGIRFHQEELMLDEWAAHGQPTCSVLGLLKKVSGLCKLDQKRPCVGCLKLMK